MNMKRGEMKRLQWLIVGLVLVSAASGQTSSSLSLQGGGSDHSSQGSWHEADSNDRMFFPDEQSFQRLDFKRRLADEEAADTKALELLKNSPYKEKLGTAGLFLKALQQRAPELPSLIRPHLGNGLAAGQSIRMSVLLATAPPLDEHRIDQIAALPLGGRIKLDPWADEVELVKARPVPLALAREKMPFEITPFFPFLTRLPNEGTDKIALIGSGSK